MRLELAACAHGSWTPRDISALKQLMKDAFRVYDLRVVDVRAAARDLFPEVAEALPGI